MSHLLPPGINYLTPQQQQHKENHINVFELTLLLKVMGFRLNYLDYEDSPSERTSLSSQDITVEIKCGKRNIVSRLSAPSELCSCPPPKSEENGHNSSFWEVLGTAPSSSPGKAKIEDTYSNLLPELSKRGVSNTKHLLALIYEGFHKDHLPSSTSTTNSSPENRPEPPLTTICTSTVTKSPKRKISLLNANMLMQEMDPNSPGILTVPPNTPKVTGSGSSMQSPRNRDHIVYMEVMAAKERLDQALLSMKMNIASEMDKYCPPAEFRSRSNHIFEEEPMGISDSPPIIAGINPATFKRRSSLGSFTHIKSRTDSGSKPKVTLARNKSSVDTAAAHKAKAAVVSRYLQPRKLANENSVATRKMSPLARTGSGVSAKHSTTPKSSTAGIGSWK